MRTFLSILVMTSAACVGNNNDNTPDAGPGTLPALEETTSIDVQPRQRSTDLDPALCALLPHDDSACAHVCDPGGVTAYVPPGTCAVFDCPLADGTTYRTGGCNQ